VTDPTSPNAAQAPSGAPGLDDELVSNVAALVESGQQGLVLNLVTDLHPADLASLLSRLPDELSRVLFRWLPEDETAEALPQMESAERAEFLDDLSTDQIVSLLDRLDTDDAADVLADVDDARADAVLVQLEDSEDVEALMSYGEDTAGGLMGTEFVAVNIDATVAQATEAVREKAEVVDPVYVVYAVDAEGRLVGIVPMKRLLLSRGGARVRDIAETELTTVEPDLDQEAVARIMERYDLVALPVVSSTGRLLGRITIDDVVDVIREEAEEDLQRAVGISGEEELSSSVFAVSRGRLPWLAIGMGGAFFSGLVIQGFEGALEQAIVLATFIPVVTATGGNAGIQSAAIAVQGLTSGDLWLGDGLRRLGKEMAVALLNGLVLGVLIGLVVVALGLGDPLRLASTVGLTLLLVILIATTNGALVPFLLQRAGVDPASAMGPFVTTLNDIIGLTVYFIVATTLYL
jgi:magnesium transporter